jgi:trans-2,3-dihydro-3-hydroxyanthranilate isomerase
MARPFHVVDVFAERPYTGNPLAVVIAGDLVVETMQRIAAETNHSETVFVSPARGRENGYGVRIFTPAREIAFAGHPILGAGWVVRHHFGMEAVDSVRLDLGFGHVAVDFETGSDGAQTVWFSAPPVTAGPTCAGERIAHAVGLSRADVESAFPVQLFSAGGTSAFVVPLRNLDALRRCRFDLERFAPLAAEGHPPLIYLFCRETHHPGNDLCARFFFEANGVREDPATGNGAAFLGAFLLRHRVFAMRALDLRIEQGHEVQRPSLVRLRARTAGDALEIRVGGSVIPTMRGELL